MKVVLATGNTGKVKEMQSALQGFGFEVIPQTELSISAAVEDGLSFVENAIKKARHACHASGLPAIADDSGLEVDALQHAPGIYSARYAENTGNEHSQDQANNQKLLQALEQFEDRQARYQCVLVYMQHAGDPTPLICQASWQGEIARAPCGDNGFGYDPLFFIPELNCSAAELPAATKNKISHRAKALNLLQIALSEQPQTQ